MRIALRRKVDAKPTLKSRIQLFFVRPTGYRVPQLILIGLLLLQAVVLMAQTGGGATLVGTVKDSTGSVVTAAAVEVVNPETSFLTQTTTQPDGTYYVPYFTPGNYRVTVSAPGFKEFVRYGLMMRSAEVPRVDIVLEVGSVNESVTVNAAASLLSTENVVSALRSSGRSAQRTIRSHEAHAMHAAVYARRDRVGRTHNVCRLLQNSARNDNCTLACAVP
jgi:Carboxypeptidase regulatory-like domain